MPIKVRALGEEVSLMRIGRRQLALRGPRKKDKPLLVIKSKSVPSKTVYWLAQATRLALAAREKRGRPLEEVINNVINKCSGPIVPEEVKEERKQARYTRADANIVHMAMELKEKLEGLEPEERTKIESKVGGLLREAEAIRRLLEERGIKIEVEKGGLTY